MSVYLPTPQDFSDSVEGRYLGEYLFYRVDASGNRSDGAGKIVFGEMLAIGNPAASGTIEGKFKELRSEDEPAFFMDLHCILQVFFKPHSPQEWQRIIKSIRFDRDSKEPYLGWTRIQPISGIKAARLQFFFRYNGVEEIVGFIEDPKDIFADIFWDFKIQLGLMFANVPKAKALKLEQRIEFYRKMEWEPKDRR